MRAKHLLYTVRFILIALGILMQIGLDCALILYLNENFIAVDALVGVIAVILFFNVSNSDRAAVYKIPWMLLFLIFPVGGCVLYFLFGRFKAPRAYVRCIRDSLTVDDAACRQPEVFSEVGARTDKWGGTLRYLKNAGKLPVSDRTGVDFLPTGEAFFARLTAELRRAERYIFMEYFIIEDGVMWGAVYDILLQKVQAGIPVYLLYDDVGTIGKLPPQFDRRLRRAGFHVRKFRRFRPLASVWHNNRDHRKITVVDGRVGFVGGVNLADEYINVTHPYGNWLDNAVCLTGEGVDNLVRLFAGLFNASQGSYIHIPAFLETRHTAVPDAGFLSVVGDSPAPIDDDSIGENLYLDIIARADRYLYITTPYFVVDTNLSDALKKCARRGVDVRLIIPSVPDKRLVYTMTKSGCASLLSAGVKVYTWRGGFIHAKTFLADDEIGTVGTVNLDYRSLVHHFECVATLVDAPALADMRAWFDRLFREECTPATAETLRLSKWETLSKSLLGIFSPLL